MHLLSILLYPGTNSGKNNLPWRSYDTNLAVPCLNVDLYILQVLYASEAPIIPQYECNCSMI